MRGVLFCAKRKCAVFHSVLRAPGAVFYSVLRENARCFILCLAKMRGVLFRVTHSGIAHLLGGAAIYFYQVNKSYFHDLNRMYFSVQ